MDFERGSTVKLYRQDGSLVSVVPIYSQAKPGVVLWMEDMAGRVFLVVDEQKGEYVCTCTSVRFTISQPSADTK